MPRFFATFNKSKMKRKKIFKMQYKRNYKHITIMIPKLEEIDYIMM